MTRDVVKSIIAETYVIEKFFGKAIKITHMLRKTEYVAASNRKRQVISIGINTIHIFGFGFWSERGCSAMRKIGLTWRGLNGFASVWFCCVN